MKPLVFYMLIALYTFHITACTNSGSSCSTKVIQCPAFKDSVFLKWFPYSDSQKIMFRHLSNGDSFIVSSVYISPSTSINTSASSPNPCGSSAGIYAKQANDGPDYFSISENIQDTNYVNISVSFQSFSFYSGKMSDSGFNTNVIDTSVYSRYYNSYTLNGITYNKVQAITKTDTLAFGNSPYRVYFAQGKGIIAFDNYVSGRQTWAIQ